MNAIASESRFALARPLPLPPNKLRATLIKRPHTNLRQDHAYDLTKEQKQSGFMGVFNWMYPGDARKTMMKLAFAPLQSMAAMPVGKLPSAKNPEQRKERKNLNQAIGEWEKKRIDVNLNQYTSLRKFNEGQNSYFLLKLPVVQVSASSPESVDFVLQLFGGEPLTDEAREKFMQICTTSGSEESQAHYTTFPGAQVLSKAGLNAAATTMFSQCLRSVGYSVTERTVTIFLELVIKKEEACNLVSTDWAEIRPVDLYPLFTMWVEAEYVSRQYGKSATSISKIADTLPKHLPGDERVDENNITINLKGEPLWIPRECNNTNKYESMFSAAGQQGDGEFALRKPGSFSSPKLPLNIPILTDWVNNKFTYSDTTGKPQIIDLAHMRKCTASMAMNLMKKPMHDGFIVRASHYAEACNMSVVARNYGADTSEWPGADDNMSMEDYTKFAFKQYYELTNAQSITFYELMDSLEQANMDRGDKEGLAYNDPAVLLAPIARFIISLAPVMIKNIESLFAKYAVTTMVDQLGQIQMLAAYGSDLASTVVEANTINKPALQQGVDKNWTPPAAPLLTKKFEDENSGLLPHQAKIRNIMRNRPNLAAWPVDAGGGKSMLAITDILYEIAHGESEPYLIMCPSHLVANYVSEIVEFTDGKINVIPITSYNVRTTGLARLREIMEAAPINTILVVDYDALKFRSRATVYGTSTITVYPVIELIRQFQPGYCLTGDTLVHTNKGTVRLDKIASGLDIGERRSVDGWKVLTKEGLKDVVVAQRSRKEVKRITTKHGVEIKASKQHPFYVLTPELTFKWVDVADLEVGDILCVDYKNSHFSDTPVKLNLSDVERTGNYQLEPTKPEVMTPSLARLLGYLVAEGYIDDTSVSFSQCDDAIKEDYALCFQEVFGIDARIYDKRVNSGQRAVVQWINELGLGVRSRRKKVPSTILRADRECQIEFLRGYFEGDAGVDGQFITATSQSFRLLQQIQNMLLNLGIPSTVLRDEDTRFDPPKPHHNLMIKNREHVEAFAATIGFLSVYRTENLRALLAHEQSQTRIYGTRYVPYLKEFIDSTREEFGDGSGMWDLSNGTSERMRVFWRAKPMAPIAESYETVQQTLKLGNLQQVSAELHARLAYIQKKGFLFDPVTKIEKIGQKDVYDIQVDGEHTFIANGLVTHNCLMDESHFLRNTNSARMKSVMTLVADIPKKRVASGTMKPDSPSDLPGQMAILDPTIFGSRAEFNEKYGAKISGQRVLQWNKTGPNSVSTVLTKLKESVVWAPAKRKEWACALPERHDSFLSVQLTPRQKEMYDAIFDDMINSIRKAAETDKNAKALLEKLTGKKASAEDEDKFGDLGTVTPEEDSDSEDAEDDIGPALQPYLADIERFVTNPGFHPYAKNGFINAEGQRVPPLSGDDLKSPKALLLAQKLREYLDTHESKALIFTNYNESTDSLFAAMPPDLQECGLLYKTSSKTEMVNAFKKNPKIRWMIGIRKSLEVGLNLQQAGYLIRMEGVWTPGEQEQGDSRIERPNFSKAGDKRKELIFDTIVADKTIDITKAARLRAKIVQLAKFDNDDDPKYKAIPDIDIIPMTLETILTMNDFETNLAAYQESMSMLSDVIKAENEEYKAKMIAEGGFKFTQIKQGPLPPGAALLARVPYAQGTELYNASEMGLVRVDNYLGMELTGEDDDDDVPGSDDDDESKDSEVIKAQRKRVMGMKCHCEFGDGEIFGAAALGKGNFISRVHVLLEDGSKARGLKATNVFVKTRTETNGIDMRNKIAEAAGLAMTAPITVPGLVVKQAKLSPRQIELKRKAAEKEKIKQQKSLFHKKAKLTVGLQLTMLNGYMRLSYDIGTNQAAVKALEAIGFRRDPAYYYTRIKSARHLIKQAELWAQAGFDVDSKVDNDAFDVLTQELASGSIANSRRYAKLMAAGNFRNYMRQEFKPSADKKRLCLFALVTDGGDTDPGAIKDAEKQGVNPNYGCAYLCMPMGGGFPGSKLAISAKYKAPSSRWMQSDPTLSVFVNNLGGAAKIINAIIAAGVSVENGDELKHQAKSVKRLVAKDDETLDFRVAAEEETEDEEQPVPQKPKRGTR
jgi:intein/homing endonuclease